MQLTPTERDRLLLFTAAELARARRARGLRLNLPEATALIADTVAEAARDGARIREAAEAGRTALDPGEVLPGVAALLSEVRVEAVFDDGSRLVVLRDPLGDGSTDGPEERRPGAILPGEGERRLPRADTVTVEVENTADVPISVSSHLHFLEANPRLRFDRAAGYGRRLAIAAGTTVRFAPGVTRSVELRDIGGERVVIGAAGFVDGPLDAPGTREAALQRARACGYLDVASGGRS
jgi:urease subunit gamma/beta